MHFNLYPAIGAVNALRSNHNFAMLPSAKSDFGSCAMKIDNRKAEPPEAARAKKISSLQKSENEVVKSRCKADRFL
ncbi:MAG: hypothetical protein GY928_15370 [Colwellia sp.]|nr:hypothetical protein [Colwellia sp.]